MSLWSKETFRHIPNSVIPVVTAGRRTQRSQPQVTATTHTCSVLRLLGLEFGVNVHSVMRKHYSELPPGHCPVCPPSSHRESGHSDKDLGSGFPAQVPRGTFYNNHLTFSPDKRDLCCNRRGRNRCFHPAVLSRSLVTTDRLPFPWLPALPAPPVLGVCR